MLRKSSLFFVFGLMCCACFASDYQLRVERGETVRKVSAVSLGEHRLCAAAHAVSGADDVFVEQEIGWLRCKVLKTDAEMDLVFLDCAAAHFDSPLDVRPRNDVTIESPIKAEIVQLPTPGPAAEFAAAKRSADDAKPPAHPDVVKTAVVPAVDTEVEVNGQRKIEASGFVLIEFNAEWCGPCRRNAANIEALDDDKGPYRKVYAINIDANPELAAEKGVNKIPCSIVYHNGKEICRHFGIHTRDEMVTWATDPKAAR